MGPSTANSSFICEECGSTFTKKYNVQRHIETAHLPNEKGSQNSNQKHRIQCFYCNCNFHQSNVYDAHLRSKHDIKIETHKLSFPSESDFLQWKEKEEMSSRSQFCRRTCARENARGEMIACYFCNRRGVYKSQNRGKRAIRAKGSAKIGLGCSARMVTCTNVKSGEVSLTYYATHTGHQHEFCYLRLPESQERLIASKLAEGVTANLIDEVRDDALSSSTLEMKHFLDRKKIFHIRQKYKIFNGAKYKQDNMSVETIIDECNRLEHNPILLSKNKNVKHDILGSDEFMIIIMTDSQAELLTKFGNDLIYIDSTRDNEQHDFHLTTIIIYDESGEAFPVCYCISTNVNKTSMTVLYGEVKNKLGTLHTETFMSNGDDCHYGTWKNVMSEPKYNLLCKWVVDADWKKNLHLISDAKARSDIRAKIEHLFDEPDEQVFTTLLRAFLKRLQEEKYNDFLNYFVTTYANRTGAWASCYRSAALLNTCTSMEAFHRVLKNAYVRPRKNNRVDVLLNNLFKILRDKLFNRRIYLEDGQINQNIVNINLRHRSYKEIDNILNITPTEWCVRVVIPISKSYTIVKEQEFCDCRNKCLVCEVCVHMFACNCYDYMIEHNLCKHIHGVVMFQNRTDEASKITENAVLEIQAQEQPIIEEVYSFFCDADDELQSEEICQMIDMDIREVCVSRKGVILDKLQRCFEMWQNTDDELVDRLIEEGIEDKIDSMIDLLSKRRNVLP